ncbi:nodulation factor fucose acetyltransferase NolL [Microvirga tunisiensis]|uniref:Acyltransferase family protein n=1 Tax=Microvirga tunisiensis TaxID=2108360 RepID=A0A5N7MVM0_9HYPH|nr:nodulation factor fucose acetyltransferase NolL [Microvirga tunisiensis]MPR12785.1 acyltransferase family protein [Microvirga tunisiensis]MPR30720.1 acyltransferase family protein [Microvirga tunisiensis]
MLCQTATASTRRGSHSAGADNRDLSFDFAKGTLIILVIVGHLLQYIVHRDNQFWYSPYFKSIYMFHMPLFMAISGYLCSGTLLRKSLTRSITDRAKQLLLPMLFWCAFIETAKLVVFSPASSVTAGMVDFSKEFIGTYWFLWATFVSFVVIKVLTVCDRLSKWIICISAIGVACVPATFSIVPLIKYTYPFFCLGFLLAQSSERWTSIILRYKPPLLVLLAIIASVCFLAWGKETYAYNNLVVMHDAESAKQVLLMFAGSVAASAVAMECVIQCWRLGCASPITRFVAVELGQSTLLLYLLQGTVFRLMDLIPFGERWDLTTRIAVASMLGVAIVVIAISVRWIVRDLGCISRVVFGASPRSGLLKAQSVPKDSCG